MNLIVAADDMSWMDTMNLADKLRGWIWGIKLNSGLHLSSPVGSLLDRLNQICHVMADVKMHDIPNTNINTMKQLQTRARILTIHCSVGNLKACTEFKPRYCELFGITLLTSLTDEDVLKIYGRPREVMTKIFVEMAVEAGLNGVVCAGDQLHLIPKELKTIVPGIRLGNIENDDQKQISNVIPNSDYIVVGRPITQNPDPLKVVKKIHSQG